MSDVNLDCSLQDLSLEYIQSNIALIEKAIWNTQYLEIDIIEYSYEDTAYRLEINKTEVNNAFGAFIYLWNYFLHVNEGWYLDNITKEDLNNIINLWLFEEKGKCQCGYSVLDYNFVLENAENIRKQIKGLLYSYVNTKYNKLCFDTDATLKSLKLNDIQCGLELCNKWDSVEFFYETSDSYIYFIWFANC